MTLPPERIGDRGQRYVVRSLDYPREGWQDFGYAATTVGALQMAEAVLVCPGASGVQIIDRSKAT